MTILITLEDGITMTVEDVESYKISKDAPNQKGYSLEIEV